jgi:type I restriction enzyme, S subunit
MTEYQIPNGWRVVKLYEVTTKIGSGATPSGGKEVYIDSGISLFRSQNIYNLRFETSGLVFIDKNQADKLSNVIVCKNDILLNITGDSVARCCKTPIEFLPARVNQHVSIIRPDDKYLNPNFLMYVLVNPTMQSKMLSDSSGGATRNALTKVMIENFNILLPPLPIQNQIAHILSSLDDKIELNRQMNRTLEGMARALFQSWFVDFDPVKAKMRGEMPHGMDEETAALFPDEMEEIDGREIPRGWRIGKFSDLCLRVENGGTPKREKHEYWNPPTIPWLTSGEVRQDIVTETDKFISPLGLENSSAKIWRIGTTIVAMYGATAGQVSLLATEVTANQACCGLIPRGATIFFLFLRVSSMSRELLQQARGSAQQNLSQGIIANFATIIAPDSVIQVFDDNIAPLFDKWVANIKESKQLSITRDSLLPRLLSGELDLDGWETDT